MAFDEALASRIRDAVSGTDGLGEKRMFGGLAFLLSGNMCCGVHGDEPIVRFDPEQTEEALKQGPVRVFDLTGRPMKGWVLVAAGRHTDGRRSTVVGGEGHRVCALAARQIGRPNAVVAGAPISRFRQPAFSNSGNRTCRSSHRSAGAAKRSTR